ncbi:MAG TPA: methyltransferase domain-containing protein [Caldilineaceae bacterium]|nr:methyltransferase domain-containing protein [Caldilineaceae bacterium]
MPIVETSHEFSLAYEWVSVRLLRVLSISKGERMNTDWNPELYLRFNQERTQPAIDLLKRIDIHAPQKILDVGCGPGNSTRPLAQRWPEAHVFGIDSSVAMIEKAKADYPTSQWAVMDALDIRYANQFDIVFSNAVIHWIPDHESLIRRLVQALTEQGVLAIQMPLYHEMPVYALVDQLYHEMFPESRFAIGSVFNFHSADYYYDLLSQLPCAFSLWETSYIHVMTSHQQIVDMIKSTGLKPYLDEIRDDAQKTDFANAVLYNLPAIYPRQRDGRVLFPFKRLFLIAGKG